MTTQFTQNDTTYTTTQVDVKGNTYAICVVNGKFNYVSVRKVTNNPFGTSGKEFANFDEATQFYKSPDMKVALLKVELGLN